MKMLLCIILMLIYISLASAETYKWEDANGMHFTDNASSIPEKYREKVLDEARKDSPDQQPHTTTRSERQDGIISYGARTVKSHQPNERHDPVPGHSILTPLSPSKPAHAPKTIKEAFMPLVKFMTISILIGIFLFLVWLSTLLDIILGNFKDSSNKIIWFLLVFFLPVIGMLLYWMIGLRQKDGGLKPRERDRGGSVTRLYTDKEKDGEFSL